jgi:predicted small secreted protein
MKLKFKNITLVLLTAVLFSVVTGCKHTANGAGQDIEKMGEKIQEKTN